MPVPALFTPFLLTPALTLKHRMVYAPCTRCRNNEAHEPLPMMSTYYAERASVPGTLIISEATIVHLSSGGFPHGPMMESEKQIAAWKNVTDAVHSKGSFIFCQLWALGRTGDPEVLAQDGYDLTAPSNIPVNPSNGPKPRSMTVQEIKECIGYYAQTAINAVDKAGFDGVEIHGANGYLIDQFLQDVSNNRRDEYGGSIENRCRFALEVINAVVNAVGIQRVGLRLSPWNTFQGMRMKDPKPTFTYLVQQLVERYPDLAYLHLVEPRLQTLEVLSHIPAYEENSFIREIWSPRPFITCGGFNREGALKAAEDTGDLIAFGRLFMSNPDLPLRFLEDLPLNVEVDKAWYYTPEREEGYLNCPFSEGLDPSVLESRQAQMPSQARL